MSAIRKRSLAFQNLVFLETHGRAISMLQVQRVRVIVVVRFLECRGIV